MTPTVGVRDIPWYSSSLVLWQIEILSGVGGASSLISLTVHDTRSPQGSMVGEQDLGTDIYCSDLELASGKGWLSSLYDA